MHAKCEIAFLPKTVQQRPNHVIC